MEVQYRALGLGGPGAHAEDEPRALTATGGLPYHGGPGNNYVMHSICAVCEALRGRAASRAVQRLGVRRFVDTITATVEQDGGQGEEEEEFGLVTANGWFLTKLSCGLYSTSPGPGAARPWARRDPREAQRAFAAACAPALAVAAAPSGPGVVETYTVLHNRTGEPWNAIVVGRLTGPGPDRGKRFVANVERLGELAFLLEHDCLGRTGTVRCDGPGERAHFSPDGRENGEGEGDGGGGVAGDKPGRAFKAGSSKL